MIKFEILSRYSGSAFHLFDKSSEYLFKFGDASLWIRKDDENGYCYECDSRYNYHGTRNVMVSNMNYQNNTEFTLKRFVVIQMN